MQCDLPACSACQGSSGSLANVYVCSSSGRSSCCYDCVLSGCSERSQDVASPSEAVAASLPLLSTRGRADGRAALCASGPSRRCADCQTCRLAGGTRVWQSAQLSQPTRMRGVSALRMLGLLRSAPRWPGSWNWIRTRIPGFPATIEDSQKLVSQPQAQRSSKAGLVCGNLTVQNDKGAPRQ